MDMQFKQRFMEFWSDYFPSAELPVTFYYTQNPDETTLVPPPSRWRCIIADITGARKGNTATFNLESIGCPGGQRYTGFSQQLSDAFKFFLSYGIPGKLEGERYKKSPDLVEAYMKDRPLFESPAAYIVFKRWDHLEPQDEPAVVIFFAPPDVLSGLFTLANFDTPHQDAVIAPFSSGCGAIIDIPFHQAQSDDPKAVLGMFDVSSRPFVASDILTFAVCLDKFTRMVSNIEESFLITEAWSKVKKRIHNQSS